MIKISLKKYLQNHRAYEHIDSRYVTMHLILKGSDKPLVKFKAKDFSDKPFMKDGKAYVVPSFISSTSGIENFIKKYPDSIVDNYTVEIDDVRRDIELADASQKISIQKDLYINMDEFVILDKMHWFNKEVISFYKTLFSDSVLFAKDRTKARKILKELCTSEKPLSYDKKILPLFKLTGVSDEAFRRFVKRGE